MSPPAPPRAELAAAFGISFKTVESLRRRRVLPLANAGASVAECKALHAAYRRGLRGPGSRPRRAGRSLRTSG